MNNRLVEDLEARFRATFGVQVGRQFWKATVPLIRMSFSEKKDPASRVNTAIHVSAEVLDAVFARASVSIHLTLWKNDHHAAVGQLTSLRELDDLGVHHVLGVTESDDATIVYAKVGQFTPMSVRELLLRIYRFEMALEPSLAATLILARLDATPVAVLIDDDRGLDIITTDASVARSISTMFKVYVYEATSQ
jgi:hypothetical protein